MEVVAPIVDDNKTGSGILLFNKWSYDDVKTFIAQEQIGENRLWLRDNPWRVQYRSIMKRKSVYVKLAETPKIEDIGGVKSDNEVVDLIDADIEDGNIVNILNCIHSCC